MFYCLCALLCSVGGDAREEFGCNPENHTTIKNFVPLWWYPLSKALLGRNSKAPEHGLIGDLLVHLKPSKVRITTVFPPVWSEMSSCAPLRGQWNLNLINRAVILTSLSSLPHCGLGSWQEHRHRVAETYCSHSKALQRFCPSKYAAYSCHIYHCVTLLLYVNLIFIVCFLSLWTFCIFERKFLLWLVPRNWVALLLMSNNIFHYYKLKPNFFSLLLLGDWMSCLWPGFIF